MYMAWCDLWSAAQSLRVHARRHAVLMRNLQVSSRLATTLPSFMSLVQEVPVAMMSWESDDTSSDQDIAAIVKTASTGVFSSVVTLS